MAAPSRPRFPQLARNNLPTSALAGLLVKCGKQAMPTPVFVAVFALCGLSIGLIGPPSCPHWNRTTRIHRRHASWLGHPRSGVPLKNSTGAKHRSRSLRQRAVSSRCLSCGFRLEIISVKFRLLGAATVSVCPSCAMATAEEPEGVMATLRKRFPGLHYPGSSEGCRPARISNDTP